VAGCAVSGKKIVTQRQRDNALEALNVMWPSVPPQNVSPRLSSYTVGNHNETDCNTIACFGGWCARWPNFVKQGAELLMGCPTYEGHGGAKLSLVLFGHPGLFLFRGNWTIDEKVPRTTSDHEVVTNRITWLIRNTEVL
jgi:hypothetical protein